MIEYPKSITIQFHQKILEQMNEINKSICYINNNKEVGLFCYIKNKNKKIPVIIINNYIKNQEYLNITEVLLNNTKVKIDIENIIYKDKINNISIIKIKNNHKNIKYIELDDKLYEKESEAYYINESIYIIQKNKKDIFVS